MKLKTLITKEELAGKKQKVLKLDYSHIDQGNSLKEESDKREKAETDKLLAEAKEAAKKMLIQARQEAQQIEKNARISFDIEKETLRKKHEDSIILLEEEYKKKNAQLDEEYKEKEAKLKQDRENLEKEFDAFRIRTQKEIRNEIFNEVSDEAKKKVMEESSQLIKQVHSILDQAIVKRREMIREFEGEITDLILLIVQKIVKVISESDRDVVKRNLHQTLALLKDREHFLVRVNTIDLRHVSDEINAIKNELAIKGTITVVEDSTVEAGGCFIETELGEVDARISTQLLQLSNRIRELSPIKNAKY